MLIEITTNNKQVNIDNVIVSKQAMNRWTSTVKTAALHKTRQFTNGQLTTQVQPNINSGSKGDDRAAVHHWGLQIFGLIFCATHL